MHIEIIVSCELSVRYSRFLFQISCIVIISISLIYFIMLYIDIRVHVVKSKRANKERERRLQLYAEHLSSSQVVYINNINRPI